MSLNKFFDVDTGYDILKMNIGADEIKCNNIDTTTINNIGIGSSSILYLNNQTYNTLDINNYDTFILKRTTTDPSPYNAEIQLIQEGLYDGQEITICVIGETNIDLTIKDGIPESGIYKTILCNGNADINLTTGSPYWFREVKLRYNINSVAGDNLWHCFQDIEF